jgi:alkaline phosphatase D
MIIAHTRVMAFEHRTSRRRLLLGAGATLGLPMLLRLPLARAREAVFALGVASGAPTASGVVLWTRLVAPQLPARVPVRWHLAHDERFERIAARGETDAVAAAAHSVHVELQGLESARAYWYRFEALGQQSVVGRTRTAPAPGAAVARLKLALASCQRWDHGHFAAWRDVVAAAPELVCFVGDYLYEYATSARASVPRRHAGGPLVTLADYRARYAQYRSDVLLQAAHAACPWIVIWDDHEVQNDYAGERGAEDAAGFAARRRAGYQAWWEHMPVPAAWVPSQGAARIHGRLDWGLLARLQWIDNRQFRDPQACTAAGRSGLVRPRECPSLAEPARSLLGAGQEAWLAEGWSTQRPWNLLVQQTLMARASREPLAPGGAGGRFWNDGWDGYPAARQRLLAVLQERRIAGAVVLGGDMHEHFVADLKADFDDERAPPVATEFCGTSVSSRGGALARSEALLRHNPHLRFAGGEVRGSVLIELDARTLSADLRRVADVNDPASAVDSAARFVVDASRPGAERA